MLGDNLIGHKEITIDNKGRIQLPKDSGVEKNDELIFIKDEKTNIIKLMNKYDIEKRIETLKEKTLNTTIQKELEKIHSEITLIKLLCFDTVKVDSRNRILLLKEYRNENKKITLVGMNNYYLVFKNKEEIDEYTNKLKKTIY